jgi:AraC-like DNA-binding protein
MKLEADIKERLQALAAQIQRHAAVDGEIKTALPGLTLFRASLAKRSHMSMSSLQHKFKATVMMGPLQYQKRLRLEEARRLLLSGLADATSAAFDVGYESPSQFIREYRRLFGLPPLRDVKRMRNEIRERATGSAGSGRKLAS